MKPLLAQLDSRIFHTRTRVVSCTLGRDGFFEVVLEQTPFYPEGGGQPGDEGMIGGHPVRSLYRMPDGEVVHCLDSEVEGEIEASIDPTLRYDRMQQHTAQHLLSALALDRFGWPTTAFHLGPVRSDIELDIPGLGADSLQSLEDSVNEAVRSCLPVTCRFEDMDRTDWDAVRSRRLPKGLSGLVRLVEIEGLDINTCGGTHVSSTGEIQLVKILGTEQIRGGTRVFYIAGHRALGHFSRAIVREHELSELLTCPPSEHLEAVVRLRTSVAECSKAFRAAKDELASLIGRSISGKAGIQHLHRPDADMDFLREVARAALAADSGSMGLLTAGGEEMVFLLFGPGSWTRERGPVLAGVLEGRGGGAGGLFQGRVGRPDRLEEALRVLSGP